jgi:hypothetical protein
VSIEVTDENSAVCQINLALAMP